MISTTPRTLIACVLFLVLAGGGVGVVGLVEADDGVFPGTPVVLEGLELPPPHIGDRVRYERVIPETGAILPDPGSHWTRTATWTEPTIVPDQDGTYHRVNRLVVERPSNETTTFGSHVLVFDQETRLGVAWGHTTPMDHELTGRSMAYDREALYPVLGFLEIPQCELFSSFSGGPVDLDRPVHMPACRDLYMGSWVDTTWRHSGSFRIGGHTYVLFDARTSDLPAVHPLRLVFRTDLPYPVSILLDTSGSTGGTQGRVFDAPQTLLAMTGFQRGDEPLAEGAYDTIPSLPPLRWTPPERHIIFDDTDLDHEFPFRVAFEALREDSEDSSLRDILARHGDAYAHSMALHERTDEGRALLWRWIMSAGNEHWYCSHTREADGPDTLEILLDTLPDPAPTPGCRPLDDNDTAPHLPDLVPDAASLVAAWEHHREVTGAPVGVPFYSITPVVDWVNVGISRERIDRQGPLPEGLGPVSSYAEWASLTFDTDGTVRKIERGYLQRDDAGWQPIRQDDDREIAANSAMVEIPVWVFPSMERLLFTTLFALFAAALYWLFPHLKHGALLPLFSRIHRGAALDHETRALVLAAIEQEPGIHQRGLARRLDLARGTLRHHLHKLVETGLVVRRPAGRHTAYWPSGASAGSDAARAAALRTAIARELHTLLQQEPELTQGELADRLGTSRQNVGYHLKRLREAGLLPS